MKAISESTKKYLINLFKNKWIESNTTIILFTLSKEKLPNNFKDYFPLFFDFKTDMVVVDHLDGYLFQYWFF